jgi:uncharacterized RDD family membrane protein YckC
MASATAVPVSGSKLDNRRVVAALIDLVIVGVGWAVILAAAGKFGEPASDIGAPLVAVNLGWALYYYFVCESGSGQTLGKRVMKIRVVGTDGAPAGMREVALRTVLRIVDGMFVYLVGLIVMLATRERRGRLGDLIGATMIVSADEPAPTAPMTAPEAPARSRVPIGESGRAFELAAVVEQAPVVEEAPVVEPAVEVEEAEQPDVASPSLKELASDVTAVTEAPEREVEEEPEPAEQPAAEADEQPVAEAEEEPVVEAEEEPVVEAEEEAVVEAEEEAVVEAEEEPADDADEPEPDAEPDEEVTVKSVETVSAIDLVMEEDDEAAVAGPQAKGRQS